MMHGHGGAGSDPAVVLAVAALALVAAAYLVLAAQRADDPRGWSRWRTCSFTGGCLLAVAALVPGVSRMPTGSLAAHMETHLLLGMYAPLALVLGAPTTLLLRSLPRRWARRLGALLRSPVVGALAHPVTGLVLTVGGMWVLYTTPLYAATGTSPLLHHLVHLHLLLSGYLFAYAVAGPDPAPHRPSVPFRLVVLGVAIAGHAVLAQLMYAGILVHLDVPVADRQAGANLMYFGGDVAELVLAFAMVATWRPARGTARRAHAVRVT